jgi:hypothetical protein
MKTGILYNYTLMYKANLKVELKINNFKSINNQLRSGWQWRHVAVG